MNGIRSKGYYTKLLNKLKSVDNDPKTFQNAVISLCDYFMSDGDKNRSEIRDVLKKFDEFFNSKLEIYGDKQMCYALVSLADCMYEYVFKATIGMGGEKLLGEEEQSKQFFIFCNMFVYYDNTVHVKVKIGEDDKSLKYLRKFSNMFSRITALNRDLSLRYFSYAEKLRKRCEVPKGEAVAIVLFLHGTCLQGVAKYEEALEQYRKSLKIVENRRKEPDPQSPHLNQYEIHYNIGRTFQEMKNGDMAMKTYDSIINIMESSRNNPKVFALGLKSIFWRGLCFDLLKSKSMKEKLDGIMLARESFKNICQHDPLAAKLVEQDETLAEYVDKCSTYDKKMRENDDSYEEVKRPKNLSELNEALDRRAKKLMDDASNIVSRGEPEPTKEEYLKAMSYLELAHKMKMKIFGAELPMHDVGCMNLLKAQCLAGTDRFEDAIILYNEIFETMNNPGKKHVPEMTFLQTCYIEVAKCYDELDYEPESREAYKKANEFGTLATNAFSSFLNR